MREDAFTVLKGSIAKKPSEITEQKLNRVQPTAYTGGTGIDHPSFKTSGNGETPIPIAERSIQVDIGLDSPKNTSTVK